MIGKDRDCCDLFPCLCLKRRREYSLLQCYARPKMTDCITCLSGCDKKQRRLGRGLKPGLVQSLVCLSNTNVSDERGIT